MKWKHFTKLHSHLSPDEEVACILWTRPDVYDKAKEVFPNLVITDEIADEVLGRMQKNSDCDLGMSWNSVEICLEEILREHELI